MKKEKKLPELPEKTETTILKVVPDEFPIESYLDGKGNTVICVRESDYKAQTLANQYEMEEKLTEMSKVLNV